MLSAEVCPYASVGGLADMVASLSKALCRRGLDVRVFSPLYRDTRLRARLVKIADLPDLEMADNRYSSAVFVDADQDPPLNFFIEQESLFGRNGIYSDPQTEEGYADNFERFNFFVLATLEALRVVAWRPDVLHCHDSHVALGPAYLKLGRMGEPFYKNISSLLTIHNLAYQGCYPREKFRHSGLPEELFYPLGPFEFYGQVNCMKAGICYADILNTVSPQYAREIQTAEFGCGLEGVLQRRKAGLYGILNGIDTRHWDPESDPMIYQPFSVQDSSGKQVNKEKLQDLLRFPIRRVPLIGMVCRLAEQKGFDLILEAQERLKQLDCQWVFLGSGRKEYETALAELAQANPERFAVDFQYTETLAHRIQAGCDIALMPSRFEPCGLKQMYSMRYGTIPVVRHTGGLADTVSDFNARHGSGTGFKFYEYSSTHMLRAIERALETWNDRPAWNQLIVNSMTQDFSWEHSAAQYCELYSKAVVKS